MCDDESLGVPRHNSTSGGKDYYPSIDELLAADSKGFKRLTGKLTKDSILCLLRDSLSQLKQAKSTSDRFSTLENKLDTLITNTKTSPGVTTASASSGKSTMAIIFKASLDERDYNVQANKTILWKLNPNSYGKSALSRKLCLVCVMNSPKMVFPRIFIVFEI